MFRVVKRFIADETGATAIEYAVMGALVSLAALAGFGTFSNKVNEVFVSNADKYKEAWN